VLFVFVIMLISLERSASERQFNRQWTIALIAAGALVAEFAYAIFKGRDSFVLPEPAEASPAALAGNTQEVGTALFTKFLLPFEIASILLLVAIVGAVILAKRKTQVD